jgi:hypothetical protein
MFHERVNDADMGETARRAAAENKPDRRPGGFSENRPGSNVDDGHYILVSRGEKALQSSMIRLER